MIGPTWLFCPADRPDRYAKAAEAADVVIIDLEDAVAPDAKASAREFLVASDLDPARTIVRVNPASTPEHALDLAAVARTGYTRVMLPKAEAPADLDGLASYEVIAMCETPRGVVHALEIASRDEVIALTWGAEDLVAALGGTSSRDAEGRYRDVALHARSAVLLAASAAGKSAIETVFLDIGDDAGARAMADDASASGFAAMMCIHPRQVPIIRTAFAQSEKQIEWARGVLEAAHEAGRGVFSYLGQMVDEPVLRQARQILKGEGQ